MHAARMQLLPHFSYGIENLYILPTARSLYDTVYTQYYNSMEHDTYSISVRILRVHDEAKRRWLVFVFTNYQVQHSY